MANWLASSHNSNRSLIFLSNGNKYYEDLNEVPGRHRWVDYARDDFNTVQLEPVWHSWLHHIRTLPPNKDHIVEASRKSWELVSVVLSV
jgi:NADH:ubiquinone oxidoreductase subunit